MKGLKIKVLVSLLLLALFQSTAATTFKVIYLDDPGEGAFDETPVPVGPWSDNPGTTLGEQRRNAHEYATRLLERMVWIDNHILLHSKVAFDSLSYLGFLAPAGALAEDQSHRLVNRSHGDYADGYVITHPQLAVLNPDAAQRRLAAGGDLNVGVTYNADQEFYYFLGEVPIHTGYSLVSTALHEFGHGLGFTSRVSSSPNASYMPTLFDRHVRLAGANPNRPEAMTPEQRAMLPWAGENVRWVGPATSEAAGRILTYQDKGQVFLDGLSYDIGHLSAYEPSQLMSSTSGGRAPLRLGITAYMLSDMGWGPVIDSRVTASPSGQNKVQVEVSTDALAEAEQLLVNLQLPEGISIEDMIASPATCETTGQTTGCRYTRLSGNGMIEYTLTGEPGIHEVKADVDHQALHVDENPVNNFATARVQVGENTIQGVTLDPGEISGALLPAGTPVGRLQVTGPAGIDHSFALARGGEHNACFRIEGDEVLTRTELDYGALSELDIRIETTADNGFRREDDLEVRVTDVVSSQPPGFTWASGFWSNWGNVASPQQQPDFTCPPVELIVFDEGDVGPTWDSGFGGRHFSETGWATCKNDGGGAGCPGISWSIVDDDSRGAVLEITNAPTNSYSDRFYIRAWSPVDVSGFEGGILEFDVRIISGDPELGIRIDCVYSCAGQGTQNPGAVVGSDWVTLSVNVDRLVRSDVLHTVETGLVIFVTNGASATYQLDRIRWVADPDYDRIDGSGE